MCSHEIVLGGETLKGTNRMRKPWNLILWTMLKVSKEKSFLKFSFCFNIY